MKHVLSPPRTPVQLARNLYGAAFAGSDRRSLQASMKDFEQLSSHDRLFIQCHLQYLTLCAQERTQQLLLDLQRTLEQQTGAVFAIADEVIRPAFEAASLQDLAGQETGRDAGETGPSEPVGEGPSAAGKRSEGVSADGWLPLPNIDDAASDSVLEQLPALPRAQQTETVREGDEDAAE